MNAEALFKFDHTVRRIDFCEGMVLHCHEGIVFVQNYFKRRNRKIERKWGENKNRFLNSKDELFESKNKLFESKDKLFESKNRFFESKDELFESKNRLLESKAKKGENKNELFESKNKLFESNGVWVKIRIAFSQMRQIWAFPLIGVFYGIGCGSKIILVFSVGRMLRRRP
jgi:hypothetical protein